LILSVFLLLLTSPVGSQSLTTVTSWTTATGEVTSTSYTTFAAGTTSITSVTTSIYSNSFTLPAELPRICYFSYVNVTSLKAGERLVGKVVVDYPLDFYVMSKAQFSQLPRSHCDEEHPALLKASSVKSYTLDWVVPSDGNYYLVFFSYNPSFPQPKITGSLTLQFAESQLIVSTLYTTSSDAVVSATTKTVSSEYYSTVQEALGGSTSYLMLLAIVVVAALIVGAFVMASRRKKPKSVSAEQKGSQAAVRAEKQFCVNCDAQLALGSKFCNKCGSAQTQ
jgi:ribosomal protein L40E